MTAGRTGEEAVKMTTGKTGEGAMRMAAGRTGEQITRITTIGSGGHKKACRNARLENRQMGLLLADLKNKK
jgi:hypothetical protein